jgi:hypothetical protein
MAQCETCGNEYDNSFDVIMHGKKHTFDSFECAIHALAPTCRNCGIRVVGHGLQAGSDIYCCDHCAEHAGVKGLKDRVN